MLVRIRPRADRDAPVRSPLNRKQSPYLEVHGDLVSRVIIRVTGVMIWLVGFFILTY